MSRLEKFIGWKDLRETGLQIWRPLAAELIGTELLVLLALGSGLWFNGKALHIGICAGFTVAIVIETFAHVSGGHINPAVTAGVIVAEHMSLLKGLLYMIAQTLGALVGTALLKLTAHEPVSSVVTQLNSQVSIIQGLTIEFLITFVLVLVAFATLDPNRKDIKISPPFVIGLSVAVGHLFALSATGASMNPARSFGPAVFSGIWNDHWIYWLAPISGGMSAAVMYKWMFAAPPPSKETSQASRDQKNGIADTGC